jgi:hypothetical protein
VILFLIGILKVAILFKVENVSKCCTNNWRRRQREKVALAGSKIDKQKESSKKIQY